MLQIANGHNEGTASLVRHLDHREQISRRIHTFDPKIKLTRSDGIDRNN